MNIYYITIKDMIPQNYNVVIIYCQSPTTEKSVKSFQSIKHFWHFTE